MSWGDSSSSKLKWGDQAEDGDGSLQETLVAHSKVIVSTPDKNGIKTITEYRTEEDGRKLKIVKKVREVKTKVRVNKHVLARRKWEKYGDSAGTAPGSEKNVTYQTHETITLNLKPRSREDDNNEEDDSLSKLKSNKNESIVVCRNCGETGHWTLKCPKREQIVPVTRSRPNESNNSKPGDREASGKYVPMHLRAGASGSSSRKEEESNTIRVTNISEDTTDNDLRDLFGRFGNTTRVFLAKDRNTNQSRGFAFISYSDKAGAQRAVEKLNGYGYDNLILHVELAKPRDDNGGGGRSRGDRNESDRNRGAWGSRGR